MHKDTYRLIYGKEDRTSVRGIAMGWIKAIGFTILGVLMIAVDRYFIRKWSTEEQTNFSNRTNERYLKNMIMRNYMHYTYHFTIIGIILILLAIAELANLLFGIEIFESLKNFIRSFFP